MARKVFKNQSTSRENPISLPTQEQLVEEIKKVAYELYIKRGATPGNDLDDWFKAEKIIKENLTKVS